MSQYVIFNLAEETYGVDIHNVREIITMQPVTQVPGMPEFIKGIINLRGNVIPIFDIKSKFSLSTAESRSTRIVVVEINGNIVGIIVDGVSEVLTIPENILENPASMISSTIKDDYISKIAKLEDKLVLTLNLDKVIANTANDGMEIFN